jgi:hypothetical protein
MSDVAKWTLRGPVRTLRTEVAEWDPGRGVWQAPRGVSTVSFRPDGQASGGESYNPDGSIARWARVYDDEGRIIEEQSWMDNGPRSRVVRSYDALGRPAAAEGIAPDGTRREAERCRYDSAGRKTKVILLPQEHIDCYGIEGTEHAYGAPGAVALSIAYDQSGLPAEASFHDASGGVVRRNVFSRDHDGRLLTEVAHFDGESPFPELPPPADNVPLEERASMETALKMAFEGGVFCKTMYAYDTKGRMRERIMYMGTLSEERTTFQYRDGDDPIADTSSNRSRRVGVEDDGVVRTTEEEPRAQHHNQYDYQYDTHGNWTERVVWYRTGSQPEFQRSNIEGRTITYYEQ